MSEHNEHPAKSIPSVPQLPVNAPQEEGVDLILPISILIASLIVAGSVVYGAKSVSGVLEKSSKVVAQAPAKDGAGAAPSAPAAPAARVEVAMGPGTVLGEEDAPVTIVEFSDLECPFCKRFHDETFPQLKKEYIDSGKAKIVFRHFPLGMHPNAPKAAEAVACARDQGKEWAMIDAIFVNQQSMDVPALKEKATQLGMNASTFASCLDSGKKKGEVDTDTSEGGAAGVSGTPTFFVNGQRLVGAQPFAQFKAVIDKELEA